MTDSVATTSQAPVLQLVPSEPPQAAQAKRQADAFMATAEALVVDSPMMFDQAACELVRIRERWKAVEGQRVHLKEPFLEGCRRIDAFFKDPLERLAAAGDTIKRAMAVFSEAEERRIAEARRLEEERARAERAELERVQREAAEQARLARERAAAAEQAARAAELASDDAAAAALADAEQARLEASQAEAEAVAVAEDAQQAMDLADVAPAPLCVRSGAVARGVSTRKTWKLKSCDKRALVMGVAAHITRGDDSWLEFLDVNESALGKLALALKGATRVDGCVFGEVSSIAATGRGR